MESFENDLLIMARGIQFKKTGNNFQRKLNEDIKAIRNSKKAFIPADKTRNIYEMDKPTYEKLLQQNITKAYKKSDNKTYNDINLEAKKIATNLGIQNRATSLAKKEAFITLKDHKENFKNDPKCRLINPAKSELGRVSKQILDHINTELSTITEAHQWRNTSSVIEWFKALQNKPALSLTQFYIVDFYPSISEDLLTKAMEFAKQHTALNQESINVIMHSRKSLLFSNGTTWTKKDNGSTFDVTMGSNDGAEVCELVRISILSILSNKYEDAEFGLYRHDGLAAFRNINSQAGDRIRKEIIEIFKQLGLKITIQCKLNEVNFLDISLNLNEASYRPYRKPNDHPQYINRNSNHPPSINKQLPQNIG